MYLLISPLSWCALALLGLAMLKTRPLRAGCLMLLFTGTVLLTPLGANALVHLVERGLPRPTGCAPSDRAPIVVLTGGLERAARDDADFTALSLDSQWRLQAGALRALAQPDARLLLTGGPGFGSPQPEATLGAALVRALGVPAARVTTEVAARNTRENAQFVKPLLLPGDDHVQLVTSDLHLPRAALAFSQAGITACAQPSGSVYIAMTSLGYLLPQSTALAKSEDALHELLGYLRALLQR
jgi:uncharacterized SAM-binding protein YcdF (DUF218 family)